MGGRNRPRRRPRLGSGIPEARFEVSLGRVRRIIGNAKSGGFEDEDDYERPLTSIFSLLDSRSWLLLSASPRSSTETLVVFFPFPTHYMLWSQATGLYALSEVRQFGRQSNRLSLR